MQGFTISDSFIGKTTADISLVNATLINGNNTGDISWWTAPESASPITLPTGVGGLLSGRNYVELMVFSQDGTPLQRAFWDPSAKGGAGIEFTQEVNTVTSMSVKVSINQSGFTSDSENLLPLAIIDLDVSLNIQGIKDKRNLFYRLGTPSNIDASYSWGSRDEPYTTLIFGNDSNTAFTTGETITFGSGATAVVTVGGVNNIKVYDFSSDSYATGDSISGGTSGASATLQSFYDSFSGADKDITNQRDAFSALANEIRVVKGTRFWYELGSASSLPTLLNYINTMVVPVSSGAHFAWSGTALSITDSASSGQASSDEIAALRIPGYSGDLKLTREDGTGGSASITIEDGSVLFVELPSAGSDRTYSESGPGSTNFRTIALGSFVPSDSNYVLAYREGQKLIIPGTGELESGESVEIGEGVSNETLAYIGAPDEHTSTPDYSNTPDAILPNSFSSSDGLTAAIGINAANLNAVATASLKPYQEKLTVVSGTPADSYEIQGPAVVNTTITLPLDSRNSNVQKKYSVGQGGLMIFLNGQELVEGDDYSEVGTSGTLSQTITILQQFEVGDVLNIRVINPQTF